MSSDPPVAPGADAEVPAEGWVGDPSAGPEPESAAETAGAAPDPLAGVEPEPVAERDVEPAPDLAAEPGAAPTAGAAPDPLTEVGAEPRPDAEAEAADAEPDPLAEAVRARDEYLDALRHLQADFENYRKRVQKQAAEQSDRATEGLVSKLLPVLDTVDLALAHASGEAEETAGLGQVATSLFEVLGKEGLVRIDALGQPFDPSEHDAVLHEAAEESGTPEVVEVLRSGWRWRERVLRPAMVKVKG